jgi:hypothetical protein
VNKHIFFTTYSTKMCFTTVTHAVLCHKEYMWEALHLTYKMYFLRGFCIVVLSGDHEFAVLSDLAANLPTAPKLNWAAASLHCGLIEQNIHFIKEKIHSLCHSLPFKMVPGIMVVRMVLHIVKFVNGFLRQEGVKHYSTGAIMTGCNLHGNNIVLGFEVYCQIAKNVEPQNSLTPRMRAAILLGNSRNLTGGQLFLALDTGAIVTRHQWVVLPIPMPLLVIDCVNFLGWREPSILTFTNRHGQNIGDNPQDANEDEESIVAYPTNTPGVALDTENAELTGVDPDFAVEPTGVKMDSEAQGYVPK